MRFCEKTDDKHRKDKRKTDAFLNTELACCKIYTKIGK